MARLPFVVEPRRQPLLERIGSEESGILEVERRGYLTTGEKAFFQQVQQADGGTSEVIKMSRRVARQHAIGMDKAYNLVLTIVAGAPVEDDELAAIADSVEKDFAEDLTLAVKEMSMSLLREEMVMAACMIKYRVNPDYEISDIASLHPDLIAGLAALYRDEEKRSVDAFKDKVDGAGASESIEEVEKKPARGRSSRSASTTGG